MTQRPDPLTTPGPDATAMRLVAVVADRLTRASDMLDEALAKGPSRGFDHAVVNDRFLARGSARIRIANTEKLLRGMLVDLKSARAELTAADDIDYALVTGAQS